VPVFTVFTPHDVISTSRIESRCYFHIHPIGTVSRNIRVPTNCCVQYTYRTSANNHQNHPNPHPRSPYHLSHTANVPKGQLHRPRPTCAQQPRPPQNNAARQSPRRHYCLPTSFETFEIPPAVPLRALFGWRRRPTDSTADLDGTTSAVFRSLPPTWRMGSTDSLVLSTLAGG
jgi:hypothetical protein